MKILTPIIKCNLKVHFILLVLALLTQYSYASSLDRRPRGKGVYNENLKNRDFPFTFMVNDYGVDSTINFFKEEIKTKGRSRDLLDFIFERYGEISSSTSFNKGDVYALSLKAKLAAFIYMIGLKYNSITEQVEVLPNFGHPDREQYATEARNILKDIEVKGKYFNGINKQRYRAFELLNYLQAYDYLKTAKSVLQNSNIDNEGVIGKRKEIQQTR
jgi:hypothetical protein